MSPPALVVGASTVMGLAIARGLRGTGATLVGASSEPGAPTCRSNLWHEVMPVAAEAPDEWMATLSAAHARYGRMALFPADDPAVRLVAEHAADLDAQFDFVLPSLPVVSRLLDKTDFHQWALAQGFPVPRTQIAGNPDELRTALREVPFPLALKPCERTLSWQRTAGRHTVYRLNSAAEVDDIPFELFEIADRYVVQEWIPGRDSDVYFCLAYRDRNGEEIAAQVGRKITQWPVDMGSTALTVTHDDPALHKLTQQVLDAADHIGFGSVEVRVSTRDGRMLITEPTVGRPDLQTGLAAGAGVNLVEIAYHDTVRSPLPPSPPAREAIWIHETAFPLSVITALRRGRLDTREVVAALLRRGQKHAFALSSRSDPLPLLAQLRTMAGKALRGAAGLVGKALGQGRRAAGR